MCVNGKFHHKEQLDFDLFKEGFFESKFCEVAINKKYTIVLSEIYKAPNTSGKEFFRNFCT